MTATKTTSDLVVLTYRLVPFNVDRSLISFGYV